VLVLIQTSHVEFAVKDTASVRGACGTVEKSVDFNFTELFAV
jgi:hypothetical protein